MGWSESEVRCKKHPKHRQSPGVCSYCLRERLYELSTSQNSTSASSSSHGSSSSFCSSPIRHRVSSETIHGNDGLRKSRSVAFITQKRFEHSVIDDGAERRKKDGFWSKLLRSSGKRRKQVLMHSRTVRESLTSRFF